jgi:hypothetical protein
MKTRLLPFFALAVTAPLLLAACGGGSSNASASTTPSTSTPAAAAAGGGGGFSNSAFTACLKQQGVSLPAGFGAGRGPRGGSGATGPPAGPSGGSGARGGGFFGGGGSGLSSTQRAAFRACRSKLPGGGFGGRGFAGGASATQLKAYLSCLGDNGVKVPKTSTSTTAGNGSGPRGAFGSLRSVRSDPKFAAANKICRALLPARGTTTPTTTAAG